MPSSLPTLEVGQERPASPGPRCLNRGGVAGGSVGFFLKVFTFRRPEPLGPPHGLLIATNFSPLSAQVLTFMFL